ncbi:hypothetical protein ACOME3_008549 [Neoechinorhynchus agilis]
MSVDPETSETLDMRHRATEPIKLVNADSIENSNLTGYSVNYKGSSVAKPPQINPFLNEIKVIKNEPLVTDINLLYPDINKDDTFVGVNHQFENAFDKSHHSHDDSQLDTFNQFFNEHQSTSSRNIFKRFKNCQLQ